jgi:hypothetical protein
MALRVLGYNQGRDQGLTQSPSLTSRQLALGEPP